jgi:hypothetical protein
VDVSSASTGLSKHPGESYIIIKDVLGSQVLFQQWVSLGGFFKMNAPQDGAGADAYNITIYSSNEASLDHMLQTFLMDTPCGNFDGSSMLMNSVGGIQLMATAQDERQKMIDARLISLEIVVDSGTASAVLTQLVIASNMGSNGWYNATETVAGKHLSPGLNVLTLDWDFSTDRSAGSMLVTVKAQTDLGEDCGVTKLVRVTLHDSF